MAGHTARPPLNQSEKPMREYAVMAETKAGATVLLRRRFTSRDAAEDFPVVMKRYRRVWAAPVPGSTVGRGGYMKPKTDAEKTADCEAAFAELEQAAVAGARCPVNGTGYINSLRLRVLADAGRITIQVFPRNWRVVTILTGPNARKKTAKPPRKGRAYVTITKRGRSRPLPRRVGA